jgi:hypothetical protein
MNIKQALKAKNKLVAEIKELHTLLQNNNSVEESTVRRFNVNRLVEQIQQDSKELVALKAKIHRANAPVFEKIFTMAELKGQVKELRKLSTEEGKVSARYSGTVETKSVILTALDVRNMIKGLESQIESIQDELDVHNATTNI